MNGLSDVFSLKNTIFFLSHPLEQTPKSIRKKTKINKKVCLPSIKIEILRDLACPTVKNFQN